MLVHLCHYLCLTKYRKVELIEAVDESLKFVYLEISKRCEIDFIELGTDNDHVHFLSQSVPTSSSTKII
uniref:transposase n=1 Tax=Chlorobium phaeobacteroides TaxID=1096 RepID=UPI0037BF0697